MKRKHRWLSQGLIGMATALGMGSAVVQAETLVPALGARSAGRGGANLAFGDNGFLLHDNPAGLVRATSIGGGRTSDLLEVSVGGLFPDLEYSDPQNPGAVASNDPFGLGALTLARAVDDQWTAGLGVYSPAGFGARWNLQGPPNLPGTHLYKSLGMLARILPGLSYQASDRLRFGGTLGVAVSHVELEGPYFLNSAPFTGLPTIVDLQSTGAALTWSLGMQYDLTDQLTIAARYQSQNRFQNQGNARITIPNLGTSYYDMDMDIVWPRSVGVGLLYSWLPCTRFGLDVDWQQWSRAYDRVDFVFRDPDNPVFQQIAGPQIRESLPLDWKDAIVVKGGVEQDIGCDKTIRFGYSHNSNTVPGASATPYLPTILTHYFTTGMGIRRGGWEYDAAYQFSFRPTMQVGQSQLAGGDNSNSSMSTQAHWMFLSASRKF